MAALVMWALVLVVSVYLLWIIGFFIAGAMGIGPVESLMLIFIVGAFAVVGLFVGALLAWRKIKARHR